MNLRAIATAGLVLLSCGGTGEPNPDELGTKTQAQSVQPAMTRSAHCQFHQKPWVDLPTVQLYTPPPWDLRDLPAGLCGVDDQSYENRRFMSVDREGRLISLDGTMDGFWRVRYDAEGRIVEEHDATSTGHYGGSLDMKYGRDGAVVSAEQHFHLYTTGAVAHVRRRPNTDCRTLAYDFELHSPESDEVKTAVRTEHYDANGWPDHIEVTSYDGRAPTVITPQAGPPATDTIVRDAAGRVVLHRFAATGDEETSEYDGFGRLSRRVRRHGQDETTQSYSYDSRGRLWRAVTTIRSATGQWGPTTTLEVDYLRAGERRERVDLNSDGIVDEVYQLSFDASGRLTTRRLTYPSYVMHPDREFLWAFRYCD